MMAARQKANHAEKLRILLSLLCVARVHSVFEGTCVRKDPPPGVLVLSPGSKLVLSCRGHVMVNGLTVNIASNSSVAPTTTTTAHSNNSTANVPSQSNAGATTVTGGNRRTRYTDTGTTASPTAQRVHQTAASRLLKTESTRAHEEKSSDGDYGEEEEGEEEEGNRVTRGINSRPQWKWNGKTIGNGKREWGQMSFERRGAVLSLLSVRPTDSGSYSCHHRGINRFSLKVTVADPPKTPSLSCYKKSPSSKLRCESDIQKATARPFSCYLILNKRPSQKFRPLPCSYSSRLSRYWYALEHDDNELRTLHMAYLCLTSITGNATSELLSFSPLQILKPDPPSSVTIHQVERRQTYMRVTWNFPISWKSHDNYYKLIYEVKYKPLQSSFHYEQTLASKTMSAQITDVMPGVEYEVQVRTRDEYDGQWSDWSAPVSGRTWAEPWMTTTLDEGSTFTSEGPATTEPAAEEVSYHALWISGVFLLLALILADYIFRHKNRFMPKLHHLSVISQHNDNSWQPPAPGPAACEAQGLLTFAPHRYKEHQQSNTEETEEKNEEEQHVEDRMEAMHFNNTSYFLLQKV